MRFFLLYSLLISLLAARAAEPDWRGPWKGLPELVSVLGSVPEGKSLLAASERKNKPLKDSVKKGSSSYTESTFARTYSLIDGKEQIQLKHEITLNQNLPLYEAVVDLAHELVHFNEKDMLDPYKPGFALKEFVENGIEGEGGEIEALSRECLVAWALETKFKTFPKHQLCARYRIGDRGFHREKAKSDYYALGSWLKQAPAELLHDIKQLHASPVIFTSSYAGKPYPIALAEEFKATKRAACQNNRRKYRLIAAQSEESRAPASNKLLEERMRLRAYDRLYCSDWLEEARP